MNNWLNWYTFVAFILGVLLSATVRAWAGKIKSRVA